MRTDSGTYSSKNHHIKSLDTNVALEQFCDPIESLGNLSIWFSFKLRKNLPFCSCNSPTALKRKPIWHFSENDVVKKCTTKLIIFSRAVADEVSRFLMFPGWRRRDIQRWSTLNQNNFRSVSALFITWKSLNSADSALNSAENENFQS